jgi:hypothetical protein
MLWAVEDNHFATKVLKVEVWAIQKAFIGVLKILLSLLV